MYRRQRRLVDRALGAPVVRTLYQPAITGQSHLFFHRLLNSTDSSDYRHHVRRYARCQSYCRSITLCSSLAVDTRAVSSYQPFTDISRSPKMTSSLISLRTSWSSSQMKYSQEAVFGLSTSFLSVSCAIPESPLSLISRFSAVRHLPSWFPGAGFKRKAAVWKKEVERLVDEPFEYVEKMMARSPFVAYIHLLIRMYL